MEHAEKKFVRLVAPPTCSFVPISWCARRFFMYVMDHHLDDAQCAVVSLAGIQSKVSVCLSVITSYTLKTGIPVEEGDSILKLLRLFPVLRYN